MEIILPESECTGCGVCREVCPAQAIRMSSGEDGFAYPFINTVQCMRCGRCMKLCPALSPIEKHVPLQCFAAQLRDKERLKSSSSGGLFSAFALEILNRGGAVYGCTYDKDCCAFIRRATVPDELVPMHGSKYVWSDASESYHAVANDLKEHRTVLFTGLPCQVAGLRAFLGRDDPLLYMVDILCGGAPSPFAFQEYLKTIASKTELKTLNFQFRDKDNNRTGVNCTYVVHGKKHHEDYLQNSFYFAFSSKSRITWRKSCYQCDYKSIRRVSDITIGDYWGYAEHYDRLDPNEGVSVALIGTEKGKELFESVQSRICSEASDWKYALPKNSLVLQEKEGHVVPPKDREAFFHTLRESGWKEAERRYLMTEERKKLLLRKKPVVRKLLRLLGR